MTKLSVNINKFATLRNSRGGNLPNLIEAAKDCELFGAEGITVHPRPDGRHILYSDVEELKPILTTEFNIEGNPIPQFIELVLKIRPAQVTLVPDSEDVLTSDSGWNTKLHKGYLREICSLLNSHGIRSSIFVDPHPEMVKHAADTLCNRVELYTESYATLYDSGKREEGIAPYIKAAEAAKEMGIGLNAGHDLNLRNLAYFYQNIPDLLEVSIGHALVCDALYLGLENTIQAYLRQLKTI
ncbi:MAG: pyridoxine 5'-phosphate synthase [Bacteroidales bacterium]